MISLITFATSALALFRLVHVSVAEDVHNVTWNLPINPADDSSATLTITGTI